METKNTTQQPVKKPNTAVRYALATTGVTLVTMSSAFADTGSTSIDLTVGLAGVAVIGGLMASGTLKALPTYVAWGIRKALSMLG
ncbi:hypothetical protein [Acinetobacter nosocomialis]|uniref:hypothetical protein n=1 Tax=Acinetobacter nosocomialis TaxID=106654 RepID=UPI0005EB6E6C|nr:hypothetical protein [Acinetobacter nosocomialis]